MSRSKTIRKFLGEMDIAYLEDEKTKDRTENNLRKKHLNSYLKGLNTFTYGKDINGKPMRYKVQQEFNNL